MKYTKSQNDIVNEYIEALNEDIAPLFLEIRECILGGGTVFQREHQVEGLPGL